MLSVLFVLWKAKACVFSKGSFWAVLVECQQNKIHLSGIFWCENIFYTWWLLHTWEAPLSGSGHRHKMTTCLQLYRPEPGCLTGLYTLLGQTSLIYFHFVDVFWLKLAKVNQTEGQVPTPVPSTLYYCEAERNMWSQAWQEPGDKLSWKSPETAQTLCYPSLSLWCWL